MAVRAKGLIHSWYVTYSLTHPKKMAAENRTEKIQRILLFMQPPIKKWLSALPTDIEGG